MHDGHLLLYSNHSESALRLNFHPDFPLIFNNFSGRSSKGLSKKKTALR